MNYNCPCCSVPQAPNGKLVKESLFSIKLIDQEVTKTCSNCGTSFTAVFIAGKTDYKEVYYKNIKIPNKVIVAISMIHSI